MKTRSFGSFFLLLDISLSTTLGWMHSETSKSTPSETSKSTPSDVGGLQKKEFRSLEVTRRKVYFGHDNLHASCENKHCGRGSHCIVNEETQIPECQCLEGCKSTYMPICGSDGKFYENHCELHRASCLQKKKIYIIHSKDCFFKGDTCTMADYNRLKHILLDLQAQRHTQNNVPGPDWSSQKHFLVESLFKYLDYNGNGYLSSSELTQLTKEGLLENDFLGCTLEDLLRFDDYNSDGSLSLQEFYTTFRRFWRSPGRIKYQTLMSFVKRNRQAFKLCHKLCNSDGLARLFECKTYTCQKDYYMEKSHRASACMVVRRSDESTL